MTTQFTSDGFTYTLAPLKVRESRRVQLILARVLAPVFTDTPNLGAALAQLTEADLDVITTTFGAACTFDDATGNYRVDKALDQHFSGRPAAYWRWLAECVRVEYADFFLELRNLVARLRPASQTPTATPSASRPG